MSDPDPTPPPAPPDADDEAAFDASLVDLGDESTDGTLVLSESPAPSGALAPVPAVPADPDGDRWAGKSMGKFKLMRQLGAGTMGRVIQAQDTNLGRIVALKVLRRDVAGMDGATQVQQFVREARAAAQIDHPHVARVYEIDQHRGWWYIATEYLEGGSLRQLVKATGPLAPARACPLISDAASALAVAHQRGMVHRDVKPANIMLTRTGRAKLVDFGLVRIEDPNDPVDFTELTVGTPDYLAPELARREAATPAADTYSLGVTLYYLLVGRAPYRGKTVKSILQQHLEAPRPDLQQHVEGCSDTLADLLRRMMAVDPAARPSMDDVATALRAETIGLNPEDTDLALLTASDGSTLMAAVGPERMGSQTGLASRSMVSPAPRARPRRRRWVVVAAVGAACLAAALAAAALWWRGPADPNAAFADHARDRAAFAERFPAAPAGYGSRPAGGPFDPADAMTPAAVPAFSWRSAPGDAAAGRGWVADRSGRYALGVDHPRAALIRADQAVFFATPAEAERAGKTVSPR